MGTSNTQTDRSPNQIPRLRIAYLCDQNPLDTNTYSGGNHLIYNSLSKHVGDVNILSNSWYWAEPLHWLLSKTPVAIQMRAGWRLHLLLSKIIARGLRQQLANGSYDLVFAAYSYHSLYNLKTPSGIPVFYTSDATPTVYKNSEVGAHFGSYFSFSRLMDPWITKTEASVFNKVSELFWPTDWLKDASDQTYNLSETQAQVIPWGANVLDPGLTKKPVKLSKDAPVELLVIGRNWFAKGGPIAFEVMTKLQALGYQAHLTVIGCTPPDFHLTDSVTVHAYLDKSDPIDLKAFVSALMHAHFMVMATYESFGFAFCEASAYGTPSICLRVGGVPVRDSINGHALPVGATSEDFSKIVLDYLGNANAYDALRITTRKEYEDHLNWDAWGKAVAGAISAHLRPPKT